MIKEHKILIILSIFIIFCSIFLVHDFNRESLKKSDYYNKFCSKYYDISCDKINLN